MPQYKLYYFNGRGRAEPARLCFAAAGVKFEDVRFTGEEWQQKKKEGFSPLGYLPMLEVDGKKLNESLAIMRYVARECGLSPKDSFEVGLCDMIVDALNSVYEKIYDFLFEKDEEKKKELREEFYFKTHLPNFLTKMTELLKCNKDGKGYIVGSKLSYADISMFTLGDHLSEAEPSILDKYPEVKANYELVRDTATVKEYLKSRPKTPF